MPSLYRCGDVILDLERARILVAGEETALTTKEASLLAYLAERAGTAVSRDQLLRDVWGFERPVATRAVDNVVRRVRRKLGEGADAPRMLFTVHGEGYRLRVEAVPGETPPGAADGAHARVTPPRPTVAGRADRFIGRTRELDRLTAAVGTSGALQIVGPGGVGKTTLALEFTSRQSMPTCLCDLSACVDRVGVLQAVGQALGGHVDDADGGVQALVRMGQAVGPSWLVLDNAEQVVDVVTEVVDTVSARCPDLRLLVTSRHHLASRAVWTLELGPMAPLDAAVLFRQRAGTIADAWSDAQIQALAELVDGLPLALELAAARAEVLGPEAMLARASASLDVLTAPGGTRHRHGALEATIHVSWDLLSPPQREDLTALTAFSRDFDVDLAGAVLPPRPDASTLGRLHDLVRASLVQRRPPDRLGLSHAVRLFVEEHGSGLDEARRRHGRCLAALTRRLLDDLEGPRAGRALARLEAEKPNLERAATQAPEPEVRVWAALGLNAWLRRRGASQSRARWLSGALDAPVRDPDLHALRTIAWCELNTLLARNDAARASALEVLDRMDASGDRRSDALRLLAVSHARRADKQRAAADLVQAEAEASSAFTRLMATQERLEQGLLSDAEAQSLEAELRTRGLDTIRLPMCISQGVAARYAGRPVDAERRYRQALDLAVDLGWSLHEAGVCSLLGDLAMGTGRFEEAESYVMRAAIGGARFGLAAILAPAWTNLGALALVRGDLTEARTRLGRAQELLPELETSPQTALIVVLNAVLCAACGAAREAEEELARARTMLDEASAVPPAVLHHARVCVQLAQGVLDAHASGPEAARQALAAWDRREDRSEFASDGDTRVLLDLLRQRADVR